MKNELSQILDEASAEIKNQDINSELLEQVRIKYLGKKGRITDILKRLGTLSSEERPAVGAYANEIKTKIGGLISEKQKELEILNSQKRLAEEKIDITLPSKRRETGRRHPISQITLELEEVFTGMGFKIAQGPETEYAYYNFDALNSPKNHPSRDLQDTFYIRKDEKEIREDDILLRCHTSSVQVRYMENNKPPIKIICPGRVYRPDQDSSHTPVFYQVEGLVVDKNITLIDLKETLETAFIKLFGEETEIRLRPHYFPFTEPSVEVDCKCFICEGNGDSCQLCKGEGWLEMLGAGVVHPKVLAGCGIDPEVYTGFAFGMGIERLSMIKYGIDDIRNLYENDIRFLRQF
ncbi:MAG: phenylalanine--tRNA ligase subunit alpha [Oscillospiraceae bacterium]|nr:phenylalanine--tRNA ligase subunit alpha [Oscillospiraceae bacterium]